MERLATEISLKKQKRSDIEKACSIADLPSILRIPTVMLTSHRSVLEERSSKRGVLTISSVTAPSPLDNPGGLGNDIIRVKCPELWTLVL
ncbi:hypothetical protein JZ751_019477 [Albula glossodonta]|uniref:Uncharacterized protein n=1 Tax=Albula glossodonta TaxID=121402 RepID=A0A8T2NQK5_9TELE|nr:hypothetical protein JZ751_019477 [Albula glossodonta]